MNAISSSLAPALTPARVAQHFSPISFLRCDDLSVRRRLAAASIRRLTLYDQSQALKAPDHIEAILASTSTGGWRIGRNAARALARLFAMTQPQRILEFGSGVSTLVLAALCAAAGRGSRIVSLEEVPAFARRTVSILNRFGLADHASVLAAPVERRRINGWSGWMYEPDTKAVEGALGGTPVDFIFVDAPANWLGGREDCRFGTLLEARQWVADQALFVTDDALRHRDLENLKRWRTLPYIDVLGVIPVGGGLGVGILHGDAPRDHKP